MKPLMVDTWVKMLEKGKHRSVKIGRSLVGVEEGVHDLEKVLDSLSASYGGGFLSGRETEEDKKIREIRASLVQIHQTAGLATGEYVRMVSKINELIEMFQQLEV